MNDLSSIGGLIQGGALLAFCVVLYRMFDRHLGRVEKFFETIEAKLSVLVDRVDREPTPVRGVPVLSGYRPPARPPTEPSKR